MYDRIEWPITQDNFEAMAFSIGAVYRHAFGEHGAVFWSQAFGAFIVVDNGGEVNLLGIDRKIDAPSIPMSSPGGCGRPCGPLTAGYRIRCKLLRDSGLKGIGVEINYGFDIGADVAA